MLKQEKRFFSFLLALILCMSASTAAWAVTQGEIDELRAKRDEIAAQREEKQNLVDELTREQAGALERKTAMDERSAYTLQQIEILREEIRLNDEILDEKRQEVEEAKALEEEQLQRYRARVRAMEENDRMNLLAAVLFTSDWSELLTALEDMGEIMKSDRELEDAYEAAREHAEAVQAEYEAVKADLESRQQVLKDEQEELQKEIDEAAELIASLQTDIENNKAEYEAIEAAEREADRELERLMAELERQRLEEERHRYVAGTGAFVWPVPGNSYVTSRFGTRVHPITGEIKSHTGMDISANTGTPIVAADSGTVTKAEVYGGYGNCVIIDHGNGYVTLYGHLSDIWVSVGDSVSQGQSIGTVGSTGLSTGAHCHFEIWSGGSRIDPEPYFSGMSFDPGAGV